MKDKLIQVILKYPRDLHEVDVNQGTYRFIKKDVDFSVNKQQLVFLGKVYKISQEEYTDIKESKNKNIIANLEQLLLSTEI